VPPRVQPRDLDGVLVRLAAAGREDRLGEVARCDLGKEARELRAAFLGERRRDVADLLGLLLDRADHARVAVTEVHVDQTRGEVEDPALPRVQPRALAAGDDERLEARLCRPRDEDVLGGVLRDRGGIALILRGEGAHRRESSPRET